MRPHGRANVNPNRPSAFGVCDRDGFLYNLRDLVWDVQWYGNRIMRTGFLVCRDCADTPQPQLRPRIIGPDPVPVINPRPEAYHREDNEIILAAANIGLGTETQVGLQVDAAQLIAVSVADHPARQYDTLELVVGSVIGLALRQMNLGYRGMAVNVRRPIDGMTRDIGFINYGLDVPSAVYFAGNGPLYVTRWYDQSGWKNDAIQVSPDLQPQLILNSPNGPAILFSGAQELIANQSFTQPQPMTQAQPFTLGAVAKLMGPSSTQAVIATTGAPPLLGFLPGVAAAIDTSPVTLSSAMGVPHSIVGVFNGAGSSLSQDGVTVSGNPGSDGSSGPISIGSSGGSNFFNGLLSEVYAWPYGITPQNTATVNRIAHKIYGF